MKSTKAKPVHTAMDQFATRSNELMVNQMPLSLLKHQAGQTPFYAYDTSVIEQKVNQLKQVMPKQLKLHYAMKANPMPQLVSLMANWVDGLDVASGNELQVALNSPFNGNKISFAGPGKRSNELTMAIASQTTINVESFNELKTIATISNQLGVQAKVAIRVNPDFALKGSGMKMGGGAQQFGIDAEQVPKALALIKDYDLRFRGFHIFTGSQNLNHEAIILAHQNVFALAKKLLTDAPSEIELLNIGGGLGIPYFPGDTPIKLEPIAESLNALIESFGQNNPTAEIATELGRYLVGEAGIYVSEVIDIKQSRGVTFAVVDGGLNHHLSASGNFGQVIRKNYPVAIGNKMDADLTQKVQIVGPLCTPLDLLANQYLLPEVEIGDLVVIYQSGAYGYTASPQKFLSHPPPIELLV